MPANAACYDLSYPDTAELRTYLPAAVALFPGGGTGAIVSRSARGDKIGFWQMYLNEAAHWVKVSNDSVQWSFTNGFSPVTFDLHNYGDSVKGVATFVCDCAVNDPEATKVLGVRRGCDSL